MVGSPSSTDPVLIDLGRKHCSVARTSKEYESYKTELNNRKSHLEHLKASGGDPHDIKHSNELVDETERVLKDIKGKLVKYVNDLKEAVEKLNPEAAGTESKESIANAIKAAKETLNMLHEDCPELFL